MLRRLPTGLLVLGLGMVLAAFAVGSEAFELTLADDDEREIDATSSVRLEHFDILRYPSGKIRQYISRVHFSDANFANEREAEISVNHPSRFRDWWVYQFSWGYDETGTVCTVLRFVRDRGMWLAACGGLLLVVAAFGFCTIPFFDSEEYVQPHQSAVCRSFAWLAGLVTVSLPIFIIARAVLRPEPMPALQSWLLAPHVGAYAASYIILLFAVFGIGRRFIPLGFLLMTVGLVLGAVWGKLAWSEWWQFDPKENWSFLTWLAFAGHLTVSHSSVLSKWLLYLGGVLIVITITWVNYSRMCLGLHSYA